MSEPSYKPPYEDSFLDADIIGDADDFLENLEKEIMEFEKKHAAAANQKKRKGRKPDDNKEKEEFIIDGQTMNEDDLMAAFEKELAEIEEQEEALRKKEKEKTKMREKEKEIAAASNKSTALRTADVDPKFTSKPCTAAEWKRSPFLLLTVGKSDDWETVISLDGIFKNEGYGKVSYLARINEKYSASLKFKEKPGGALEGLISFLGREKYNVRLLGEVNEGTFCVKGIHILEAEASKGEAEKEFSLRALPSMRKEPHLLRDDALQVILEKLLKAKPYTDNAVIAQPEQLLTSKSNLQNMFEICKNTYPENIQQWAAHSFQSLESSQLGSDDKRHILKALSYVLNINWTVSTPQVPDLEIIQEELDRRFLGLDTVKERILEIAAQIRHTGSLPKWGILLHGPAGVGKTSIANVISDILGMPKAYVDFSAVEDGEGLTGSSRIYSNATPGLIISQLYEHRTANLVMVLNEIDKAAKAKHQPLNTLLPLLDGMGFMDTYLEVTIPTQGILFIATCNEIDCISKPILDRFYRIDIPAYSRAEKSLIFKQYILPDALEKAHLDPTELTVSAQAEETLLSDYAVEPGIRDIERYTEKLITHYLMKKEREHIQGIEYTAEDIRAQLGVAKRVSRNYADMPGMAFSAFVEDGCPHIISVQALARKGNGELKIVSVNSISQHEYCQVAYECMRSLLPELMGRLDIILTINQPLCESAHNYVGFAVCAAILSAVKGTSFSTSILFWGGCDLLGTFYSDDNGLDFVQERLGDQFDTIYAAYGVSRQVPNPVAKIVELPTASALVELTGVSDLRKSN